MPVFARRQYMDGNHSLRPRSGSSWTDDNDQWFARDEAQNKLIYPDPADLTGLLPVESLTVTSVTHIAAVVTWTNPTQPYVTPTDVQVRLAELGSVWNEMDYPITTWNWAALSAQTGYTAQVRLIRRVDGVITHTSPIRSVSFTTSVAPVGPPAPGGGGGGDTDVPSGGGTDNPGPPGTAFGCWWVWVVQSLGQDSYTWTNTALTGEADGDTEDFEIDFSSIEPGTVVRVCRREACDTSGDGVADIYSGWECGLPFTAPVDWDVVCAGALDSTNVTGLASVADAVFRYPQMCKEEAEPFDRLVMREAVQGYEIARGPGWYAAFTDAEGEQGVLPAATQTTLMYATMVAPVTQLSTMLVDGEDWTVVSRFRALTGEFDPVDGRSYQIGYWGGIIRIKLTESATGWTPSAIVTITGGQLTLTGPEIPYATALTHTIGLRWDDDADLELFVDGTSEDSESLSGVTAYPTVVISGLHASPAGVAVMQQLGWDRALTDEEFPTLSEIDLPITDLEINTADSVGVGGHSTAIATGVATSSLLFVGGAHRTSSDGPNSFFFYVPTGTFEGRPDQTGGGTSAACYFQSSNPITAGQQVNTFLNPFMTTFFRAFITNQPIDEFKGDQQAFAGTNNSLDFGSPVTTPKGLLILCATHATSVTITGFSGSGWTMYDPIVTDGHKGAGPVYLQTIIMAVRMPGAQVLTVNTNSSAFVSAQYLGWN